MTTRTAAAVIVTARAWTNDGADHTLHYGPFLPHAGSAATWFVDQIESELAASDRYEFWAISVEDLFIAEGESNCCVQPVRSTIDRPVPG